MEYRVTYFFGMKEGMHLTQESALGLAQEILFAQSAIAGMRQSFEEVLVAEARVPLPELLIAVRWVTRYQDWFAMVDGLNLFEKEMNRYFCEWIEDPLIERL